MKNSEQRPSPFLGWFEAGADLLAAQLSKVTATVNHKIDESHQMFDELQHKGEDIDAKLRSTLNPQSVLNAIQDAVVHNPIVTAMTPGRSQQRVREAQLDVLSAKVDALVEHVALLAAKQAAAKATAAKQAKMQSETEREKPKTTSSTVAAKKAKQVAQEQPKKASTTKASTSASTKQETTSATSKTVTNRRKAAPAKRRVQNKPATKN